MSAFERTVRLLGKAGQARLAAARVALFGVGGVGSFTAEALGRAGIGDLTLVDADEVAESNLNRQLVALRSTIGRPKAEVMRERLLDINPDARVHAIALFYDASCADAFDFSSYDLVLDAIDSVKSKLLLAQKCAQAGTPLLSCMGAGNKLDPTRFRATDIAKTSVCPLARVMRRELRALGIEHLRVVFSDEPPRAPLAPCEDGSASPGSISFVPSAAGLVMAAEAVRMLLEEKRT